MAYKSDPRGSRPVTLIAIHTTEGSMTAESLGGYFYRDDVQASSHSGSDDKKILNYVPFSRSAWTIRSGNPITDNLEICGFASWTREQWLGVYRSRLEIAAAWTRARCLARNIPRRKLSSSQVAQGMSGVIGHINWTEGKHDGTHTDPGNNFPWDVFMKLVAQDPNGDDELDTTQSTQLHRIDAAIWDGGHDEEGEYDALMHSVEQLKKDIAAIKQKVDAYLNSQSAEDLNEDRGQTGKLAAIETKLDALTTAVANLTNAQQGS